MDNVRGLSEEKAGNSVEFGWDAKNAGINILVSEVTDLIPLMGYIIHLMESLRLSGPNKWIPLSSFCFMLLQFLMKADRNTSLFLPEADRFVCSVLPESPTKSVQYSPGKPLYIISINS